MKQFPLDLRDFYRCLDKILRISLYVDLICNKYMSNLPGGNWQTYSFLSLVLGHVEQIDR